MKHDYVRRGEEAYAVENLKPLSRPRTPVIKRDRSDRNYGHGLAN